MTLIPSDERLPIVAAMIFGLAYIFVTPPFEVPDEVLHFFRTEALANGHLMPNGGGVPDSARIPQGLVTLVYVMQQYHDFPMAFDIPLEPIKQRLVGFPSWYTPVPFLPHALASWILRLLNVRPLIAFYAGRLANLAATIACIAVALRVARSFAPIVAAVALLPISLFEFASWSSDALTIAASLLFVALLLAPEVRVLPLALAGVFVGLCKPAYFLSALLVFAVPRSRFRSSAHRAGVIVAVITSVALATVASFAWAHRAAYQQRGGLPINPASQLQCIISDPLQFSRVLTDDLTHHGRIYVEGMIGRLGTGEISLPSIIMALEILTLVAVALTSGLSLSWLARVLSICIAAATVGGVIVSQYLSWSIVCGDTIEGVQGRYFLPVLPLVLAPFALPGLSRRIPMWVIVCVAAIANAAGLYALLLRFW